MRRHLLILLVLTVLVRGWMMVSYPMAGTDDNQAGQLYLIHQLLQGNLLIGNFRYQPGYPFVIAPVMSITQHFGDLGDRIILLVQLALSATMPFMVYDILRRRRTPREAFIVALFMLFDPFGLQWSHFFLPEWLIAFCLIFALWLIDQGLRRRLTLLWTAAAGLVLGIAGLARYNFAPLIAVLALMFFALRSIRWCTRLLMFVTVGAISGGILLLYLVLIMHPSTGTWEFSCISGINMLEGVVDKGMTISAQNGPASALYLDYESQYSARPILFTADTYRRWQQPGPWATPDELKAFENNTVKQGTPVTNTNLVYFLGACPADALMHSVFFESVRAQPVTYVLGMLRVAFREIVQLPTADDPHYLPTPAELTPTGSRDLLGFEQVHGWEYTGQWVWMPGIELFSALFSIWNLYKWLAIPALIWAAWKRDWFYGTVGLILVLGAVITAAVEAPEARLYSWTYPLAPILIGGMVAAIINRVRPIS